MSLSMCRQGLTLKKCLFRLRSLSSQVSEASEALSLVNEETEKDEAGNVTKAHEESKKTAAALSVPKLDRDRTHSMTYAIASKDKLEAVNRLLYASYHPDEPITKALGLYKGPGSIPDADRRVENSVKRNLSLFAYDKNGNEVGVCINNGYYRTDFMDIIDNVSSLCHSN